MFELTCFRSSQQKLFYTIDTPWYQIVVLQNFVKELSFSYAHLQLYER